MAIVLRQHSIRQHGDAKLLLSGSHFFHRLEEIINSSRYYLHLQFYIFDEDQTGKKVILLLQQAVNRGVKVMLVIDGYASSKLSKKTIAQIRASGILFKQFSPIENKHFRIGRRMHHKIVVSDGHLAMIGGINISDKYSGYHGKEPWLDFALELTGVIVKDIERVCESVWRKKVFKRYFYSLHRPNGVSHSGPLAMRLLQNDWWRRRIEISKAYKDAIRNADKELCIVASYFLPGNTLRRMIKKASARGVRIKILLGGFSDVRVVRPATKFLYEWMLKQDIEIYEWNRSILHGKLAIADDKWTTVGSYNLNALSDYGSLELNVEIWNEEFAKETHRMVTQLIDSGSERITYQAFRKNSNLILYAYRWICYQIVRIGLMILFILMRRDRFRVANKS